MDVPGIPRNPIEPGRCLATPRPAESRPPISIHVSIQPGLTPDQVSVRVSGYERHKITAAILADNWGIQDLAPLVKQWAESWHYRNIRIDEIVWDATELGEPAALAASARGYANFYGHGALLPLCVQLAPTAGRLLEIQQEVVLVDRAIWDNRGNPDPRHFEASMGVTSSTSVESSWERSQSLGVASEIGTSIGPVDAKTSISYTDSWGESHGKSTGEDISFNNSISGDLEPGELQVAAATQQRGFAHIQTDFGLSLAPYSTFYRTGTAIGFRGNVNILAAGPHGDERRDVREFAVDLIDVLNHFRKPKEIHNSRTDVIGVFADADLRSYPIAEPTQEAIESAVGAHGLRTTYCRTRIASSVMP